MIEEFLPWYNENYTKKVRNVYRELPREVDIEKIFSIKYLRKAKKDNTISFEDKIYQLFPLNGIRDFSGRWIEVCETLEGEIKLFYKDKEVLYKTYVKDEFNRLKKYRDT